MKKRDFLLAGVALFLLSIGTVAWRGSGGGGSARSPQKQKTFEWPGRYLCEQCNRSGPASIPESSATPTTSPVTGCWNYELTILREEDKVRRGQVVVKGPDGELGLKSHVMDTPSPDMVEFHYTEAMDASKAPSSFKKDDVLFALQHRDDDILLRFRAFTTKLPNQTVITCQKNK